MVDGLDTVIIKAEPDESDVSTIVLPAFTRGTSETATSDSLSADVVHNIKAEYDADGLSVGITRPQRKRQRLIMELTRKKETEETKSMKLKKLFKLKGKKRNDVSLSDEILLKRLEPVGLDPYKIELPRLELNQMVTRNFMSAVYGGSMQATFPKIGKAKFEQHGLDDFMYLHLAYHPYAPQTPGGCGLWFSTEEEDPKNYAGLKRVFTRDWKESIWQYMGQYVVKASQSLTLAEWLKQPDKVRNTWAKEICKKPWGAAVCARIQLRKQIGPRREPSEAEVSEAIKKKLGKETTSAEVQEALDTGKDRLGVWTMKCVDYDCDFQLELCQKFPQWIPPPPKQKGKNSAKKAKQESMSPPPPLKTKKRKRVEIETDSEEEFASELETDDDGEEDDLIEELDSDEGNKDHPIYVE